MEDAIRQLEENGLYDTAIQVNIAFYSENFLKI